MLAKQHAPYKNRALEKTVEERDKAISERTALKAICAELRDHLLLVLPAIDSYAAASPVMVRRASDARTFLRNLEARALLAELGECGTKG
jgi:hypothetical protein